MRAIANRPAGAAPELRRVTVDGIVAAGPGTKISGALTMRALRSLPERSLLVVLDALLSDSVLLHA